MQVNQNFQPTIVAFCCNWCSYAGADLTGTNRLSYPANVKIIRIPCSCRLNPMFILRAFQRGADGVILCGCSGMAPETKPISKPTIAETMVTISSADDSCIPPLCPSGHDTAVSSRPRKHGFL